jgi:hypothetical protein
VLLLVVGSTASRVNIGTSQRRYRNNFTKWQTFPEILIGCMTGYSHDSILQLCNSVLGEIMNEWIIGALQ